MTTGTPNTSSTPISIEASGLRRSFVQGDQQIDAVMDASLKIHDGEFVAIVGASGSGKTTLLQLLAGLDTPDDGEVVVGGNKLADASGRDRTRMRRGGVGIIFQQFNLLPTLSARENVLVALAPNGSSGAKVRADELLADVGLEQRTGNLPTKLSGGEQQRVAIARALANDPGVLLADEPTGNLDTDTGNQVIDLLVNVVCERGRSLVVVTHDDELAERADRMYRMIDGVLTEVVPAPPPEPEPAAVDVAAQQAAIDAQRPRRRPRPDILRRLGRWLAGDE